MNALLTVPEVAALLRLPRSTIYFLAEAGRLPGFKAGRQWRFRKEALEQWVKDQEQRVARGRSTNGSRRRKRVMQAIS